MLSTKEVLRVLYCKSRIFRMHVIFVYFVPDGFRTKIKCMWKVQSKSENTESAAVSDCTKISCVRKAGELRIRKLSAYEIFWIYSTRTTPSVMSQFSPSNARSRQQVEGRKDKKQESFFKCAHMNKKWSVKVCDVALYEVVRSVWSCARYNNTSYNATSHTFTLHFLFLCAHSKSPLASCLFSPLLAVCFERYLGRTGT